MTSIEEIARTLQAVTPMVGPESMAGTIPPIYEFLRRHGPMLCTDIVFVPESSSPSVLLAKRNNEAVAPGDWWMFGGRVDKGCDYMATARGKARSEIGLDVEVSPRDIIGFGTTIFAPNTLEETVRDYTVATAQLCLARQVPLTEQAMAKLKPADGHEAAWRTFEPSELDASMHPYVLNAAVHAMNRFYGKPRVAKEIKPEVSSILGNPRDFIPLSYDGCYDG